MNILGVLVLRDSPGISGRARVNVDPEHCLTHQLVSEMAKLGLTKLIIVGDDPTIVPTSPDASIEFKKTPISLSGSDAKLDHFTRYALGDDRPNAVLTMTLDAPFVKHEDIDKAWRMFKLGRYQSVVAVAPEASDVMKQLRRGRRGLYHEDTMKRKVYSKLGSLIITGTDYLVETGQLIGMKSGIVIFPLERAMKLHSGWDLMAARAYHDEFRRVGFRPSEPKA